MFQNQVSKSPIVMSATWNARAEAAESDGIVECKLGLVLVLFTSAISAAAEGDGILETDSLVAWFTTQRFIGDTFCLCLSFERDIHDVSGPICNPRNHGNDHIPE